MATIGSLIVDVSADIAPVLRDYFMLADAIPSLDSPKATMLAYDQTVADLGQPGTGYDPIAVRDTAQRHIADVRAEFDAVMARGIDAARAEGWI